MTPKKLFNNKIQLFPKYIVNVYKTSLFVWLPFTVYKKLNYWNDNSNNDIITESL